MTAGITVDPRSPVPAFEQIRQQVVGLVAAGALSPGDRLPTVRQLASDLRLTPGTVSRAYQELEREGWVVTGRGAGTRVADPTPLGRDHVGKEAARQAILQLTNGLLGAGMPSETVRVLLLDAAARLGPQ